MRYSLLLILILVFGSICSAQPSPLMPDLVQMMGPIDSANAAFSSLDPGLAPGSADVTVAGDAAVGAHAPCVSAGCLLSIAAAGLACGRDPSDQVEAQVQRELANTPTGDVRRQCEVTASIASRAANENKNYAKSCALSVAIAGFACRKNIMSCGLCAQSPEPSTKTMGLTCNQALAVKVGLIAVLALKAKKANDQAGQLRRVADQARTCEADVRSRNQCTSLADFTAKPECRFELCPNVGSAQGLTSQQVQERIQQALGSLQSQPPNYVLTATDRSRICSAAVTNCQNPEFRNDPVCRCEREPTGPGCRNVASVTTTTRPGDGGGSPTNGGPPTGGGSPTGGGPNNTLPGSFTNGDGPPTGEGPGFNDGRGNGSNNNGLRLNAGSGSGSGSGSGGAGGVGSGVSGSSALGGGGSSGGTSEGGVGGSSTAGTGMQPTGASEGEGFAAGTFGDEASGGGSAGGRSFGLNPNQSFGGAGGYRKPGAAGLSVNHGQDRIGVSGENMFLMIERQYKRQRTLGTLLPEGP